MNLKKTIAERPWLLAAGALALAALWMLTGVLNEPDFGTEYAEPVFAPGSEAEFIRVQVRNQLAEPITRYISVYGQTAPARTVEMNAETEGRVEVIGALRGERVTQGGVIVRLDLRDRQARIDQAQASVNEHRTSYSAQLELQREGYVSDTQLAETVAKLEAAKAELVRAELDLDHMDIRAPFDGVLQERYVEIGDFVRSGDEVATFVDNTNIIVTGSIAEQDVGSIAIGDEATAKLVTGQTVRGRIRYLAPVANQQTRTFNVELEVPNPDGTLPAGVTAELRLPSGKTLAHKVSPSLLTLAADGSVGIKTVNEFSQVEFYTVEIAESETDGVVWVVGLPETSQIIIVGHGYVSAGRTVDPVIMDSETAVAAERLP